MDWEKWLESAPEDFRVGVYFAADHVRFARCILLDYFGKEQIAPADVVALARVIQAEVRNQSETPDNRE